MIVGCCKTYITTATWRATWEAPPCKPYLTRRPQTSLLHGSWHQAGHCCRMLPPTGSSNAGWFPDASEETASPDQDYTGERPPLPDQESGQGRSSLPDQESGQGISPLPDQGNRQEKPPLPDQAAEDDYFMGLALEQAEKVRVHRLAPC